MGGMPQSVAKTVYMYLVSAGHNVDAISSSNEVMLIARLSSLNGLVAKPANTFIDGW
jgi:hypothetical protein